SRRDRAVRAARAVRPHLQQRRVPLGAGPSGALHAAARGAGAWRATRRADADERRPRLAPDGVRARAHPRVPPAPARLRAAAAPARAGAVRVVAAPSRFRPAARSRAGLRTSAGIARAGDRMGPRHAPDRLPEASHPGRLGAIPGTLSGTAVAATVRRAAVFLHVSAHSDLGDPVKAAGAAKGARQIPRLDV